MTAHELWLTGPQANLKLDRDTEFSLSILPEFEDVLLSDPLIEIERSRVEGRLDVPAALIPVPTLNVTALKATGLFTPAMTGGLNNLVPDGMIVFCRYRFRARAADGPLRTYCSGIMAIGPIGYGMSSEFLDLPYQIATGDIIIGGTTVIDPGDPPPDGEDTLAQVTFWDDDFVEAWESDVYTVWEAQP